MLLFVDFHKRYDPSLRLLRDNLQSGRMGELLYGYLNIEDTLAIPVISFSQWAHRSSPAWFIGIHMVDALNWAIGKPPVKVFAMGQKQKLMSMGIDTYDNIHAVLIYENGASISADFSWVLPMNFPSVVNQNVRLVGTEGIMEIDGQHRGVEAWLSGGGSATDRPGVPNPYGFLASKNPVSGCCYGGYTIQSMEHFVHLLGEIADGKTVAQLSGTYPDGDEAVMATRVVEAVHESVRISDFVEV